VVFSRNFGSATDTLLFVIKHLPIGRERAFFELREQVMKPANLILTMAGLLVLAPAFAQNAPPPQYDQQAPPYDQQGAPQGSQQPQQNAPLLTPEQMDTMVAPIALYPDPMLGQVLAASTYPLEVVEAQQWLQQNGNLHGQDLLNAARQQNWDPSVQALVAFPDILTLLNRDIRWTGDLGNAYLAQQQDVMNAVQRMRFRARQNGRLQSTPQQTVTTQSQNGQDAVVIEPSNPQEVYVPTYNPDYVWGPPEYGYYPPLYYPSDAFGFGFGPGIYIGGFFPSWGGFGWGGWGLGWGWGCGWWGGGIYVNNFFFSRYGFRGNGFYGGVGRYAWQHDAFHRAGVPYSNANVAARFNNTRFAAGRNAAAANGSRSLAGRSFSGSTARGFSGAGSARSFAPSNRAPGGNYSNAYRGSTGGAYNRTPAYGGQAYRGNSYSAAPRTYSAPSRSYSAPSAPRSYSAPSAPRSFSGGGGGGARSFSGGGGGGGHFSGGGSGGHSGGGGGGHGGGGHR
jgi:hypothetical protein